MALTGLNKINMKRILLILILSLPLFAYAQIKPEGTQLLTSAGSYTVSAGVGKVIINPSALLASITITLPLTPADRDIVRIYASIGTTGGSSTVATVMAVSAPIQIVGAVIATGIGGMIEFEYDTLTNKWYRKF